MRFCHLSSKQNYCLTPLCLSKTNAAGSVMVAKIRSKFRSIKRYAFLSVTKREYVCA
eukprot:UN11292